MPAPSARSFVSCESALSTTFVPTPTSRCRFGISRCNITPPVGIYHRMWGASLHDRSTGVHRPLLATVIAMSPLGPDEATQFIIALDHCLLRPAEMRRLHDEVSRISGIPAHRLLFTFSHTHAAGYLTRLRADLPGGDLIAPYLDSLPQRLAAACLCAHVGMQAAHLTYASTVCSLGRHRDYWDDAQQKFGCGFNPDGKAEQTVLVVRVTDRNDQVIATIVNYGCHPTTLAWRNTLISPDYVGTLRETVEQATRAPCAFLLSPCGNVGPWYGYVEDPAVAERHGRQLGYAALSALESMPPAGQDYHYEGLLVSGATLGLWGFRPLSQERKQQAAAHAAQALTIELDYLPGLPTPAQAQQQFKELSEREADCLARADAERARGGSAAAELQQIRALAERARRAIDRVGSLPEGPRYPYQAWVWRWGDALWVALEGEPYNEIQARLRQEFADRPVLIVVLANGSRSWYIPARDAYDKPSPTYPVEIAVVAPGSLERIGDALAAQIRTWLQAPE